MKPIEPLSFSQYVQSIDLNGHNTVAYIFYNNRP